MEQFDWKQLKSGTDIRGVAVDGVEGEPLNLTDEVVERLAVSFRRWLAGKTGKPSRDLTVSVGHDSRISAGRIKKAVCDGLTKGGVRVMDCGLASTPAMFLTTMELACDGAMQITASHHPYHRNGLKFFTPAGGLDGGDITDILAIAASSFTEEGGEKGELLPVDFMEQYAARLRRMIADGVTGEDARQPLSGLRLIVDAGNGVGGFYATSVLQPLGADITGSQFLEPDGMFPNHIPNPEDGAAMEVIRRATVTHQADLGIIFDTDVDRAGCVDKAGREINRNRLVALASALALEGNAGGTIVTDSITSDGYKLFLEETLGGRHHRFKRGYKNVIDEAIRLNNEGINAPLAIETSGHAAFRENHFLDDGAYLITKILIVMANLRREGRTLEDLIAGLREAEEEKELRLAIREKDFRTYGNKVISRLEEISREKGWSLAQDSREGVRVSFPDGERDGWFLLRLSVHDPIMPLNIESNVRGGVLAIARQLYEVLKEFGGLNLSSLEAFLQTEPSC